MFPMILVSSSVGVVYRKQKANYFSSKKLSFDVLFFILNQYSGSYRLGHITDANIITGMFV